MQIMPSFMDKKGSSVPFEALNEIPLVEQSVRSSMFNDILGLQSKLPTTQPLAVQKSLDAVADQAALLSQAIPQQMSSPALPSIQEVAERQELRKAVERGADRLEQAASETKARPANFNRETAARNVRVEPEDLNKLKDTLKAYGLSDKDISELSEKVNSKGGLTWGEFVRQLTRKMNELKNGDVKFDTAQAQQLTVFFQKLDLPAKEAEKLVQDLAAGRLGKVVETVQAQLGKLPKDRNISITPGEAQTFLQALRLPAEATSKLMQLFPQDGSAMKPEQLQGVLTMVKQELLTKRQALENKDRALVAEVGKTMKDAVEREIASNPSMKVMGNMADAKVIRQSLGADREIAEESKADRENGVRNGKSKSQAGNASGKNTSGQVEDRHLAARSKDSKDQAGMGFQAENADPAAKASGARDAKGVAPAPDQGKREEAAAWKEFFGKLRTDDGAVRREPFRTGFDDASKMNLLDQPAAARSQTAPRGAEKNSPARVLEQVQDAVLKNLGQGTKQLTLKLDPADLGQLNVVLQVRNKEVTAIIRAEDPETAKIIGNQLESLRKSLEEQGLKVAKLDVQTGLADQGATSDWKGAQGHNQAAQQEAMAQAVHVWGSLRSSAESLAHEMQSSGDGARVAQQGLHIIA